MKTPLGTEVDLGRGHIVLDGDSTALRKRHSSPPLFGPCLLWPRSPISAIAELLFAIPRRVEGCVDLGGWIHTKTRTWTNAQCDGRPAEYSWRPMFNAAKFGRRPLLECSNGAKTRNPLKLSVVPQTSNPISAVSGPKFAIL